MPEQPGVSSDAQKVLDSFARTTDEIFTLGELRDRLSSGKKLRIKYGVDVTAPFLHIGHAVNLWMMRELQEIGHTVVFLIGDFTTRIGDPTGKSKTRPVIAREEIEANAQLFIEQVSKVLLTDPDVFEIRRNSEWYDQMSVDRFLSLVGMTTHARLISRDMFQRRIAENSEIHMHEMLYPVLQGYDSVELESDLTIVGSDQLFNEMLGRFYQERFGQDPQIVLTTKITPGIDGREKQSKSLGNYIAIGHSPREIFGRAMSIPDDLIAPYLRVYTKFPLSEIEDLEARMADRSLNPRDAKRQLAGALVARYHGEDAARAEDEWFLSTFSHRAVPDDVPEVQVPAGATLFEALKLSLPDETNSALRRLLGSGAVSLDGEKLSDENAPLERGGTLKVGKRRWFKLLIT